MSNPYKGHSLQTSYDSHKNEKCRKNNDEINCDINCVLDWLKWLLVNTLHLIIHNTQ